jgi:hypothetical protein
MPPLRCMGMNNEFNYRLGQSRPDPHLPLLEQYCRTRSPEGKKPRGSNARIQALLQRPARRGRCGVVQKIIKGQFDVPASFGTDPFCIWYNMLTS